jgi:aldose 1-epimerase
VSLATVQLSSADGTTKASFAPTAGMVCSSLTYDNHELLDLGRGLDAYAERGKTMGIPLLYPWANRLAAFGYTAAGRTVTLPEDPQLLPHDTNGLPIHGLVPHLMRWEATQNANTLSARLDWSSDTLLGLFPYRHEVHLHAEIATGVLTIGVVVSASAEDSVPISFGFHPYLRLPTADRAQTTVELPACERVLLDELSIPTGAREPLGPTTFKLAQTSWDDGLSLTELPARFASRDRTPGAGHGIELDLLEGYPDGQVYAPPDRDYICFEPMTAPTNALRSGEGLRILRPGEHHRAVFRISRVPS